MNQPDSSNVISFFVPGLPRPGGSKKAFVLRRRDGSLVTRPNGSPVVNITDDAGKGNKEWRANVAFFARQAYRGDPLAGPLFVTMIFTMPRPKNHCRTGKNAGQLRPDAPAIHVSKPDSLKLARSTEDAMTGIIWKDDSQVQFERGPMKEYGEKPGCLIEIRIPAEPPRRSAPVESPALFERLVTA
jgi:Holliday junction resolvase RusA-like endonuclease